MPNLVERQSIKNKHMKRIVVFASGSGTNAENIIRFFNDTKNFKLTPFSMW